MTVMMIMKVYLLIRISFWVNLGACFCLFFKAIRNCVENELLRYTGGKVLSDTYKYCCHTWTARAMQAQCEHCICTYTYYISGCYIEIYYYNCFFIIFMYDILRSYVVKKVLSYLGNAHA